MHLFTQVVITGLLSGAVLSLIGIGFTLVLGVARIANFAHGGFVGLGMYAAYWGQREYDISPYVLVPVALVVLIVVGWAVADLFEWRGSRTGEIGELLVGLSLLLLIDGALELKFGTEPKTLVTNALGSVGVAGLRISGSELLAAAMALAVGVLLFAFIRYSRWGRALSAVAQNPEAAGLYGVPVPFARRASVILSIVIAGLTGLIIAPFSIATPDAGATFLISAFAVVILGGVGNTLGALVAGLMIGLVEAIAAGYLPQEWAPLAPLAIILTYLLIRPVKGVA